MEGMLLDGEPAGLAPCISEQFVFCNQGFND